ncbi:seipin-like [Limulus polyphemus]|uniref:Seipin n=1 Tax=Limulus polyphemus TaxID=6850 RepID=A0ABM1BLQ2_LIMPO|nr:seipin-like [Limulus polyphemus]
MITALLTVASFVLQRATSQNIKFFIYQIVFISLTFSVIIWLAVFFYGAFYYSYIPAVTHVRPVHLQFDTSCGVEVCSFPSASVPLVSRVQDHLLKRGQSYKIYLEIEMPESEVNRNLGMFMVKLNLYSVTGEVVSSSYRSGLLKYKSNLFRVIHTFFYMPLLLLGARQEKQMAVITFFENYQEHPEKPAVNAYVEIQSKVIQIYSATLKIHADFQGLRYFMFYWPVISAFVGISTNIFFLSLIAFLSWYRFILWSKQASENILLISNPANGVLVPTYEASSNGFNDHRLQTHSSPDLQLGCDDLYNTEKPQHTTSIACNTADSTWDHVSETDSQEAVFHIDHHMEEILKTSFDKQAEESDVTSSNESLVCTDDVPDKLNQHHLIY